MESNSNKKTVHKTPSKPPQNPQTKSSQKKNLPPQAPKIFCNPDSLEDFESLPLELATKNEIFEIQRRTITLGPEDSSPPCQKPRSTSLEEKKEEPLPPQKKGVVSQSLNSNELISKLKSENIFLRNENNLLLKKLRFSEQKNNELLKVKGFTISLDKLEGKEEEELLSKLNAEKLKTEETERKLEENNRKIEESLNKIGGLESLLEKISKENENLKNKENILIAEVRRSESETERKDQFINDLEEKIKVLEEGRRDLDEKMKNLEMCEFGLREENSLMRERINMDERMMEENADYFEKEVRKLKELIQIAEKELFEWRFKYDQTAEDLRKKDEMLFESQNKIEFLNVEKGILVEENQEINMKLTQLMNAAKLFNNPHSETTNQLLEEIKAQLSKSQIESQRFKLHSMNLEKEWSEKYSQLEIRSKNKITTHMNQIENLKEQMTLLFFELERLQTTNNRTNEELKGLKKENNNLLMRGQENERIIEELKINNKEFQKNKEAEFHNLVQTNTLLLKSQNEREFQDFANKFEKEKVEMLRETNKTKNLIELREGQVEDLKKKLFCLDATNIELRNQIHQLNEVKMNSSTVNDLHFSIIQKENAQLKSELEDLKLDFEENNEIQSKLIEDLRSQLILAKTEKNSSLEESCQYEDIQKLLEKISRLQILNDENILRISCLELRNSELKSSLAQQELEKENLKLEISTLKREKVKFEQRQEEILVDSNLKKNEPIFLENVRLEDFSISLSNIHKKQEKTKLAIPNIDKNDDPLVEDNEQAEYKNLETFSERNEENSSFLKNLEGLRIHQPKSIKKDPSPKKEDKFVEVNPIIQSSVEVQTDYLEPDADIIQDKHKLEDELNKLKIKYDILEKDYEDEKNSIPQIKFQKRTEDDFNENYERIRSELEYKDEDFDDYQCNFLQNVEKYISGLPQTTVLFKNKEFNISEYHKKSICIQTEDQLLNNEKEAFSSQINLKKSIQEDKNTKNLKDNPNELSDIMDDLIDQETDQFQKSLYGKKKETSKKNANLINTSIEKSLKSENLLDKSAACNFNSEDHEKINFLEQQLTQYKQNLEIYEQKIVYYQNIQRAMPETDIVQTARFIEVNSEKKKVLTTSMFFARSDEKAGDLNKISDFTNNDRSNTMTENFKNSDFIEKSKENNLKSSLCLEWNIPEIENNKNLSLEISESYKQETNKHEAKTDNESIFSPKTNKKIVFSEKPEEEERKEKKDQLSTNHPLITKKEINTNLDFSIQEPFARSLDYSPISNENPFRSFSLRMHRPRRSLNLSFELYSKTMKQDLQQSDLLQRKDRETFNLSANSSEEKANLNLTSGIRNNISYKISDETQPQMNDDISERKRSVLMNKESGENLEIIKKSEIFVAELKRENNFLIERNIAMEKEIETIKLERKKIEERLIEETEKTEKYVIIIEKVQKELDEITLRLNEKESIIEKLHMEETKLVLDVENSKKELEIQIKKCMQKEEEISNANECLRRAENDMRSLKETMEVNEKKFENFIEQKNALEKQLNDDIDQNKEEKTTFTVEINGLKEDLSEKSRFLKLKEMEMEELQLKLEESLIENAKKNKTIEETLKLNKDLKITLEATLKQKEEENHTLNNNLNTLKNEFEMRTKEIISIKEQELIEKMAAKQIDLEELKEKLDNIELENNEFNRIMNEKSEQNLFLKETQSVLESTLKQKEEESKVLYSKLDDQINDLEAKNQEILSLKERLEKTSLEKDGLITSKNAILEKLQEISERTELEKNEFNRLMDEQSEKNVFLKDRHMVLETVLKQKEEENENLNGNLVSLKNELEAKIQEVNSLREKLEKESLEKDSLITYKNAMKEELEKLHLEKIELDRLMEENLFLNGQKILTLELASKQKEEEIKTLNNNLDSLIKELEMKGQENIQIKENIETISKEKDNLMTIIEKFQEQSEKMEEEKNELNRLMNEKLNENDLLKENVQDLNSQMNKLMIEENELKTSQNELIQNLTIQMKDFESKARINLENKEKEKENLLSELNKFHLEKSYLKKTIEEKEAEQTHLNTAFSDHQALLSKLNERNNILENEKQTTAKQIVELSKKYTNLEARNKNILSEYLSLNSEFELIKEKYDALKLSESLSPDLEKMKLILSKQDNLTENFKLDLQNIKQEKLQILKEKEDQIQLMEAKFSLKDQEISCLQSELVKTLETQDHLEFSNILQLEQQKHKAIIEELNYYKSELTKLSIELSTSRRSLEEERSTSLKKYSDLFEKYEFLLSCSPSDESSRLRSIITKNEAKIEHLLSLQNYQKSELRSILAKDPKLRLDQAAQTERIKKVELVEKGEQTDQEMEISQRNRRVMSYFSNLTPIPQRNRSFYESSHFFVSPRKSERDERMSGKRGCFMRTEPSPIGGRMGRNEFSLEEEMGEEKKRSSFNRKERGEKRRQGEDKYERKELNVSRNDLNEDKKWVIELKDEFMSNIKYPSIKETIKSDRSQLDLSKTSKKSQKEPFPHQIFKENDSIGNEGENPSYNGQSQPQRMPFSAFERRFRSETRKKDLLSLEKFDLIQKLGVMGEEESRREVIGRLEEIDQMFNLDVDYGNEEILRKEGRMMEEEMVKIRKREKEEDNEEEEEEKEEEEQEEEEQEEGVEERKEEEMKREEERKRKEEILFNIMDDLKEENIDILLETGFFEENDEKLRNSFALKIEEKKLKLQNELKHFQSKDESLQESVQDEKSLKILEKMTSLYPECQVKQQEILSNLNILNQLKELNSLSFIRNPLESKNMDKATELHQNESKFPNTAQKEIMQQRKRLEKQLNELKATVIDGNISEEKIKRTILAQKIIFLSKIETDPNMMTFLNNEPSVFEKLEEGDRFDFLIKQAEILEKTRSKYAMKENPERKKERSKSDLGRKMSLEQINSSKRELIRKLSRINLEHSNRSESGNYSEYRAQLIEKAGILDDLSRLRKIEEDSLDGKNVNLQKIKDIRKENEELDEIVRIEKVIMIDKLKKIEQKKLETAEKKGDFAQKIEAISKIVQLNKGLGRLEEPLCLDNLLEVKVEEKDAKGLLDKKLTTIIEDLETLIETSDQKEEALMLLNIIKGTEKVEIEEERKGTSKIEEKKENPKDFYSNEKASEEFTLGQNSKEIEDKLDNPQNKGKHIKKEGMEELNILINGDQTASNLSKSLENFTDFQEDGENLSKSGLLERKEKQSKTIEKSKRQEIRNETKENLLDSNKLEAYIAKNNIKLDDLSLTSPIKVEKHNTAIGYDSPEEREYKKAKEILEERLTEFHKSNEKMIKINEESGLKSEQKLKNKLEEIEREKNDINSESIKNNDNVNSNPNTNINKEMPIKDGAMNMQIRNVENNMEKIDKNENEIGLDQSKVVEISDKNQLISRTTLEKLKLLEKLYELEKSTVAVKFEEAREEETNSSVEKKLIMKQIENLDKFEITVNIIEPAENIQKLKETEVLQIKKEPSSTSEESFSIRKGQVNEEEKIDLPSRKIALEGSKDLETPKFINQTSHISAQIKEFNDVLDDFPNKKERVKRNVNSHKVNELLVNECELSNKIEVLKSIQNSLKNESLDENLISNLKISHPIYENLDQHEISKEIAKNSQLLKETKERIKDLSDEPKLIILKRINLLQDLVEESDDLKKNELISKLVHLKESDQDLSEINLGKELSHEVGKLLKIINIEEENKSKLDDHAIKYCSNSSEHSINIKKNDDLPYEKQLFKRKSTRSLIDSNDFTDIQSCKRKIEFLERQLETQKSEKSHLEFEFETVMEEKKQLEKALSKFLFVPISEEEKLEREAVFKNIKSEKNSVIEKLNLLQELKDLKVSTYENFEDESVLQTERDELNLKERKVLENLIFLEEKQNKVKNLLKLKDEPPAENLTEVQKKKNEQENKINLMESNKVREILMNEKKNDGVEMVNELISQNREELMIKTSEIENIEKKLSENINQEDLSENSLMDRYRILLEEKEILNEKVKVLEDAKTIIETKNLKESRQNMIYTQYPELRRISDNYEEEIRKQSVLLQELELKEREFEKFEIKKDEPNLLKNSDGNYHYHNLNLAAELKDNKEKLFELIQNIKEIEGDGEIVGESKLSSNLDEKRNFLIEKMKVLKELQSVDNIKKELQIISEEELAVIQRKKDFLSSNPEIKKVDPKLIDRELQIKEQVLIEKLRKIENDNLLTSQEHNCNMAVDQNDFLKSDLQIGKEIEWKQNNVEGRVDMEKKIKTESKANSCIFEEKDEIISNIIQQEKELIINRIQALEELDRLEEALLDSSRPVDNFAKLLIENKIDEIQKEYPPAILKEKRKEIIQIEKQKLNELENLFKQENMNENNLIANEKKITIEKLELLEEYKAILENLKDPNFNLMKDEFELRMRELNNIYPQKISDTNLEELINNEKGILFKLGGIDSENMDEIANEKRLISNKIEALSEFERLKGILEDTTCSFDEMKKNEIRLKLEQIVEEYPNETLEGEIKEILIKEKGKLTKLERLGTTIGNELKLYQLSDQEELRANFSNKEVPDNKFSNYSYKLKKESNLTQIKKLELIFKEKSLALKKLEILEDYAKLQSILIETNENLDYNLKNDIELKKEEIMRNFPNIVNEQNFERLLNEERSKIFKLKAIEIDTKEKLINLQSSSALKSGFSIEKERLKEEVIQLEEMKNLNNIEPNNSINLNDIKDEQKKLLQTLKQIENLEKLLENQNIPPSNKKIELISDKKSSSSKNVFQIDFMRKEKEYQHLNEEKEKIIDKINLLKNLFETSNEEKKENMEEIIKKYPEFTFNNIDLSNIPQQIEKQKEVLSEKMKEIENLEIDLKMGQEQQNYEKIDQKEPNEQAKMIMLEKEAITNKIVVLEEYHKLNEILIDQSLSIDAQSKQNILNRIEEIRKEYPEQITVENIIEILTQQKVKLSNFEEIEAKLKLSISPFEKSDLSPNEKPNSWKQLQVLDEFDQLSQILIESNINLNQPVKNEILTKIDQLRNKLSEREKVDRQIKNQTEVIKESLLSEKADLLINLKELEVKEAESNDFETIKNLQTQKMIIEAKIGLLEKLEYKAKEPEDEEKLDKYYDSPVRMTTPERVINEEEIIESKLILIQQPEDEILMKKFEIFDELQELVLQNNNPDLQNLLSDDFLDKMERIKRILIEKIDNKEDLISVNKVENPLNFKKKGFPALTENEPIVPLENEENYRAIIDNFHSQADVENEKKRLSLRLEEIEKIRQKIIEEKHIELDDPNKNANQLETNIVSTPKFFEINKMEKLLAEERSFILKKLEDIDNSDPIEENLQMKHRNITCETESDPFYKKTSDFNLLFSTKNSEINERHRPINFEEIISEKNELNNKIRDLISRNEELKVNYERKIKEMQATNSFQELPSDFSRKNLLEKVQSSPSMQINETHKQEINKLNQDLENLKTKYTKIASSEKPKIKKKPDFINFTISNRTPEAIRILIEQVVYEGLLKENSSNRMIIRELEEQMEDFELIKQKFQELNEEYVALEEKYTSLKNRQSFEDINKENNMGLGLGLTSQIRERTVDFQENEQNCARIEELEGKIKEMEDGNDELVKLNGELNDQIAALTNERVNFLKICNEKELTKEAQSEGEFKYKNNESKRRFTSFHIGENRGKEEEKVDGLKKDEKIEGLCDKISVLTQENELLHKEFLEMKNKLDEIRDNNNNNDKFNNFERNFDDLKNLLMKHELKLEEFRNEKKPFEFSIEREPEKQIKREIIENKEDLQKEVDKWKKRAIYLATERQYLMKQKPDQKDSEPININFEPHTRSSNKIDLLKRVKHLEDEKASLIQKLENLKLELFKYEAFFKKNAVFELEKKNKLSDERILSMQDEIEFLTKKYELAMEGKNKENEEYRTQNKNYLLENQRLRRTNDEYEREIEALNLQLETMRKKKENSEINIGPQSIFNDQSQEINTLLSEIDRLNEIINNKNSEIFNLIEEGKKLSERIEELSVSCQESLKKEKINRKNEEKSKIRQEEMIKLLEERNKKNEEKLNLAFEEKLKVSEQKNDNLLAEVEKKDKKIEVIQQELSKIKKIEEKNKKIADDLQQKLNENISSMHMIEEIENSLKRTEDRLKKNGHTIRQSTPNQATYERITEISLRLSDENLKTSLTLERQNKKLKDIYNELEIQQEKNKELEITIQNIEEENENLLNIKADELKSLQLTHKDELSSLSSSHKSILDSLRNQHFNDLNELRSQHQAKMSSITVQYQNEIVELQNKTAMLLENQLNSELAILHTKHKNQLENLKTQLESQKSDYEAKILTLKDESQAKLLQMENDNLFYIERIKDLENGRVRELENEITRLKNRNLENEVKIEKLDKKLNERSLELNRKQIEVEDWKKRMVETQNKSSESFENLKNELERGIKSKLAEELKIVYQNFEEEKNELVLQIDEWRTKCEMMEKDLAGLFNIDEKYQLAIREIEAKASQIADLESLLSQKVQNFDHMKSILLSNLRSSLTSQFQELESEKHSIWNQLQLEQQKNANLESKIVIMENELARKHGQRDEMERNQVKKHELERKISENVAENVNFLKEKAGYEREIEDLRDKVREFEEKEKKKEGKGLKENKKVVEMKLKRK